MEIFLLFRCQTIEMSFLICVIFPYGTTKTFLKHPESCLQFTILIRKINFKYMTTGFREVVSSFYDESCSKMCTNIYGFYRVLLLSTIIMLQKH